MALYSLSCFFAPPSSGRVYLQHLLSLNEPAPKHMKRQGIAGAQQDPSGPLGRCGREARGIEEVLSTRPTFLLREHKAQLWTIADWGRPDNQSSDMQKHTTPDFYRE